MAYNNVYEILAPFGMLRFRYNLCLIDYEIPSSNFYFLIGTVVLTAQSANIVDADGWTNVRVKPFKDSEVITRVVQGKFFF